MRLRLSNGRVLERLSYALVFVFLKLCCCSFLPIFGVDVFCQSHRDFVVVFLLLLSVLLDVLSDLMCLDVFSYEMLLFFG